MSATDNTSKRKFEEYHDPDYPPLISDAKKSKNSPCKTPLSADEKTVKFKSIIKREFEEELNRKEQELNVIEHKLIQSKRLLQRIRYAIVSNFYEKKKLEFSEQILQHELTSEKDTSRQSTIVHEQKSIHPSLKKLLGKKPIDYSEILKVRPPRQAAKSAKTIIREKIRWKKNERKLSMTQPVFNWKIDENTVKPRYVEPTKVERHIDTLNTPRGRSQTSHLIAVGNTSKYVGDEKCEQGVTHKWLIYVKMKTNAILVQDIVAKARFYLHPSFKPNDVVEVDAPPFQISRRGWGEFPVRVQLYFHPHVNQKPLQVIHNLVLDQKRSGLQTIGAETVVELWLKLPVDQLRPNEVLPTNKSILNDDSKHQTPIPPANIPHANVSNQLALHSSNGHINCVSTSGFVHSAPKIKPLEPQPKAVVIKTEASERPTPVVPSENANSTQSSQIPVVATPKIRPSKLVKCLDTKGNIVWVELRVDPNNPKNIQIIRTGNATTPQNSKNTIKVLTANTTPPPTLPRPPSNLPPTQNGTLPSLSKPLAVAQLKPSNFVIKSVKPKQESLLKPQISLLKPHLIKTNTLMVKNTANAPNIMTVGPLYQRVLQNRPILIPPAALLPTKQIFVKKTTDFQRNYRAELNTAFFEKNHFLSTRSAVEYLLKKIPIINPLIVNDARNYSRHFPFSVSSVTIFYELPKVKQNFLQWYQAKCIGRMVSKHTDLTVHWTTKEIVIFARQFGYVPLNPSLDLHQPYRLTSDTGCFASKSTGIEHTILSMSTQVGNWIDEWYRTMQAKTDFMRVTCRKNEIVDVDVENDDDDDDDVDDDDNDDASGLPIMRAPTGVDNTDNMTCIPMDIDLQNECSWISEACSNIDINIRHNGKDSTMYSSVPLMLHRITRNFVEDLLRRAYGAKFNECNDVSTVITTNDIHTAVYDVPKFDFLSKKNMATHSKDPAKITRF